MIGIRCSLRFKTTESKNLGTIFKQMNKDTKQLFGDLIETSVEKKNQIKLLNKSLGDKMERESNNLNQPKSKIDSSTKSTFSCL